MKIATDGRDHCRGSCSDNTIDSNGIDHTARTPAKKVNHLGSAEQDEEVGPRSHIRLRQLDQLIRRRFHHQSGDVGGKASQQFPLSPLCQAQGQFFPNRVLQAPTPGGPASLPSSTQVRQLRKKGAWPNLASHLL